MSQLISLDEAKEMIKRYSGDKENILAQQYQGQNILPTSETFNRDEIEVLLGQQDCVALRVYFSMDENMLIKAVLVGVNSQKEDILPTGNEKIVEKGDRCPTVCPAASALTS